MGAFLILLGSLAGCGDDGPSGPSSPYDEDTRPENVSYAADLVDLGVVIDEMVRTSTGMYYRVLQEGDGEVAAEGDSIAVAYTGWLPDGEEFDSGSFEFDLGVGRVIDGWDEGVEGMQVGERRLLVIPWWLGYQHTGTSDGVIPPYAPLVFDVELLEIVESAGG